MSGEDFMPEVIQLGPSARRLQCQHQLQLSIPKSSTLGPSDYAISKSPGPSSRFFKSKFLKLQIAQ